MFEHFDRYRSIVDDWDAFVEALERPLPTCAWANPIKIGRSELLERLARDGIEGRPLDWHPTAFLLPEALHPGRRIEHILGLFQVQEEAALGAVEFLQSRPGDRVLDMCAAPGNKTAQIAVSMNNSGTVVGNDLSYSRIRALRNTGDRLGLLNVVVTEHDAGNFPNSYGPFDAVLADVPCSCEGTTRKNPGALGNDPMGSIHSVVNSQRAILYKAFQVCRPGGRVVYSTCTYAPEENECVVQDVLDRLDERPQFVACEIEGFESSPGLSSWQGREFDPQMRRAMRVWPHHNDTGGFFVAAFERSEETS